MPKNTNNTKMLSNPKALEAGVNRAAWKIDFGRNYFHNKVPYDIEKVAFFDHREAATVAALLIDISSVANASDEIKEKFYTEELKKFEQEFVLSNDPQVKHRFMRRLCEALATRIDINWDNEAEIDYLVCSLKAQQTSGTTAEKAPFEIFSHCITKEDAQWLDGISIKNLIHIPKFANALAAQHRELAKKINYTDSESLGYRLRMDITEKIQEAIDNGTNVISIDPTASGTMRNLFLDNEFDIVTEKPNPYLPDQIEETHYTDKDAMRDFVEGFYEVSTTCINEQLLMRGYVKKGERSDLLFINGKSMTDIINEKKKEFEKSPNPNYEALVAARKVFRNALRDGTSVVSLMRANVLAGGKIAFTHQEIKVDLDKLNKLERKEKHNMFRRALDFLKIYKIKPKYSSNAQRDAKQEEFKANREYQKWMKDAEKKFINTYNEASKEKREEEDQLEKKHNGTIQRDKMFQAFPEVSHVENENELENLNSPINNAPNREKVTSISKDLGDNKEIDSSNRINQDELDRSNKLNVNIK